MWIERLIRLNLSPEQIVGRMRLEGTRVMSHETIYRWIWKDKAAGGWLWLYLRGARKQRRKRYGRYDSRGRLAGKKMIGSRPAAVGTRKRIGDWEIDTVHGKSTACVLTIVERHTGLVRIGALKRATKDLTTCRTISLLGKEAHRVRTITADNGCEFHDYGKIEAGLQASFYFAVVVELAAIVRRDGPDTVGFFAQQGDGPARREVLGRALQGPDSHQPRVPLHDGEHACGALAVDSVDFPVTDAFARPHRSRAAADHLLACQTTPAVIATIAFAPLLAGSAQVEPKPAARCLVLPDPAVDGFMTHHPRALQPHPADDLLRTEIETDQTLNPHEVIGPKAAGCAWSGSSCR